MRCLYNRPIVFEHLSALLSTPTQYSVLLIERAVVNLLRLCRLLAQKACHLRYQNCLLLTTDIVLPS
jgi:hypothetical protein